MWLRCSVVDTVSIESLTDDNAPARLEGLAADHQHHALKGVFARRWCMMMSRLHS
jgi:hypothetical protein